MKFIELFEKVHNNPDLEFKLDSQDGWSICEGDGIAGIYFLDNNGGKWWPTQLEIEHGVWEIKNYTPKTKSLFVSFSTRRLSLAHAVLENFDSGRIISSSSDIDLIQSIISEKISEELENIIILNWKWLSD